MITLIILLWIVCGILCGVIARSKGRDTVGWIMLGFVFGIFGLIAIAGMPILEKAQGEEMTSSPPPVIIQKMSTAKARFLMILIAAIIIVMLVINFTVNPPAYP